MKVLVLIAVAVMMMLTASVAFAGAVSTSQTWSFSDDLNVLLWDEEYNVLPVPLTPDAGTNIYGTSIATINMDPMNGTGWYDTDAVNYGPAQGWVDIGPFGGVSSGTGNVALSIANTAAAKHIVVSVDWWKTPSAAPVLTYAGSTTTTSVKIGTFTSPEPVYGEWWNKTWTFDLETSSSNPLLLTLNAAASGTQIDRIVVLTSGFEEDPPITDIPEAGSLMLAFSGLAGIVAMRRRYA